MVSFSCETCNDTLKKPKLDQHAQRCWAVFTCLDCNTTFQGTDYRSHTSCISEDQKYQKSVYKAPKGKGQKGQQNQNQQQQSAPASAPITAPVAASATGASVNGVHPSRQHMVDAAAPAQKRAREEPVPVAQVVEATAESKIDEPAPAKKSKKDKKKEKKAKEAQDVASAATGTPAVEKKAAEEPTPRGTISSFLSTLLPTLLTSSKSLTSLRSEVVSKAKEAGWKDEAAVVKAFEEGLWLGGEKAKKMLQLKYEA